MIATGLVFVIIFHVGVKEKAQCYRNGQEASAIKEEEGDTSDEQALIVPTRIHITVKDWLKEHQFYQVRQKKDARQNFFTFPKQIFYNLTFR